MAGTTSGVALVQANGGINITFFKGKTVDFNFTLKSGGTPINVTGYTARMQLRPAANSSTVVAEFTAANSRISVGTTDGVIGVSMTAAHSAELPEGTGVYDMEFVDTSGKVCQAFSGKYTIQREVTR